MSREPREGGVEVVDIWQRAERRNEHRRARTIACIAAATVHRGNRTDRSSGGTSNGRGIGNSDGAIDGLPICNKSDINHFEKTDK